MCSLNVFLLYTFQTSLTKIHSKDKANLEDNANIRGTEANLCVLLLKVWLSVEIVIK